MSDQAFAAATAAITAAGRRMDRFGWVPATARNLSVRLPDGTVAITRSGGHKGFLDADGVIRVGLDGRPLRLPPGGILFLSDVAEELDAAAAARMQACQMVRAADGTVAFGRHPEAADFPAVARAFGSPVA